MKYVNDQFFELTGHSRRPLDEFEWFGLVADEDLKMVEDDWSQMLAGKKSDGVQFRLKKTWVNQDGFISNTWVQSSNYAELDKNGKVTSKPRMNSIFVQMLTSYRYLGYIVRHFGMDQYCANN